jgi:hypothetical protein
MSTTVVEPDLDEPDLDEPTYDQPPGPDIAGSLRRARVPLLIATLVVATTVGLAVVGSAPVARPLDPTDPSPAGTRAVVALLREQGTEVNIVQGVNALRSAPDTTVVVSLPEVLGPAELATLADNTSDLVLVAPEDDVLSALAIPAKESDEVSSDTVEPRCDLPEAQAAGTVTVDGLVYSTTGPAVTCYSVAGNHAVVVTTTGSGRVLTVVGSRAVFANHTLDKDGNAALALGLLSNHRRVDWLLPVAPTAASGTERHGLFELLPGRLWWALLEVVIALLLFAFSRGRRLGPLVTEPLPVVVRAAETVEGRSRLLRGARARGSGAEALRAATRRRLGTRLGLGPPPYQAALVERVASRTGRGAGDVTELLYGSSPVDDRTLVALATALDRLEEEMRRQ